MSDEKEKPKLTDSEKIDIILRNQARQHNDIEKLKEKKQEVVVGNQIKKIMSGEGQDGDFMLQGKLHSLPQVRPEEQQQFFKELRTLMVKYKIINVIANLTKKF